MILILTAPTALPVTVAQAKAHLRIDASDEDDVVERYLRAAIGFVQTKASVVLAPTTLQQRFDYWPGLVKLARGPVRDVREVAYLDEDGAEQEVAEASWMWEPTDEGADFWLVSDFDRPSLQEDRRGTVRITFDAGFDDPNDTGSGDDPSLTLPDELVQAVLLMTGHFFENREAVSAVALHTVELAVDALIHSTRVYR